ncbi:unnamed protein product, partial [Candidula unifasciata]
FVSPQWNYCSKHLRRLWSTFTLTQESITEEMTFAHAPRTMSSHNCHMISSLQVVRSNVQPPRPSKSENGTKSPKELLKSHNNFSPRTSLSTIASSVSQKASEEKDKRRSITKPGEQTESSRLESSAPKYVTRTRPTYFKATLSSKNRISRGSDVNADATFVVDKPQSSAHQRVRPQGRMMGSKLAIYASTPNLIAGLDDDDDDEEPKQKAQTPDHFSSTSNLRMLSDLSQSVPDVKDADSSTDSSSGGGGTKPSNKTLVGGRTRARLSVPVTDKQLMPPPQSVPASSRTISSITFALNRRDIKEPKTSTARRKSATSELTLDQAKSILLGKSGVLGGSSKPTDVTSPAGAVRAVRNSRGSLSSDQSSLSALTSSSSPPVFDSELAHTNPIQLAVAEEIENTANMLRHQKSVGIISSEHSRARSSDLEASPLDLPERDQPHKHSLSSKLQQPPSTTVSSSQPNLGLPASKSFQQTLTSRVSADPILSSSEENSDSVFHEYQETDSKNSPSVKVRIAQYQSHNPAREVPVQNCSLHRRILPASPNMATLPADNSQPDVSVSSCQLALNNFRSQLESVKDLFTQVDGRTDEHSQEILAMMGQVFHEAKDVITDLASRTPGPSQKNPGGLSLQLQPSSVPQSSQTETFQAPPLDGASLDGCKTSSSTVNGRPEEAIQGNRGAILTATKDLLQPLVSQLSQDLSEGIWKLIRERVDETF